jgi:hypothetical protein
MEEQTICFGRVFVPEGLEEPKELDQAPWILSR